MTRPTDWSSLGYPSDPIPGDPVRVDITGRQYIGTADSIKRAAENLRTALDPAFGQSEAVDAVREVAGDVADRIARAEDRYRRVGDTMVLYAVELGGAQADSITALGSGDAAELAAGNARNIVNYYDRQVTDPSTPPGNISGYTEAQDRWQGRLDTAETNLTNAIGALQTAIARRDRAAATAIGSIEEIGNSGDLNDSTWDNIVQWVDENKELLDAIGQVLSTIAGIAGLILLFIPGLNVIVAGILAAVVLINVAYQLLNSGLQVAAGTMTAGEMIVNVGLAALNLIGIGATLKFAVPAIRTTVAVATKNSWAGAGLRGMTLNRALGIVDDVAVAATKGPGVARWALAAIGLDARLLAPMEAIANITLRSGALATGSLVPMQIGLGITGLVNLAGGLVSNPIANAINPHVPQPTWRVGGDW